MTIALDATGLDTLSQYRGIGVYTRGLFAGMRELGKTQHLLQVRLTQSLTRWLSYDNDKFLIYRPSRRSMFHLVNQSLAWELRHIDGLELYHACQLEAVCSSNNFPTVVTVHDLIPVIFTKQYGRLRSHLWHYYRRRLNSVTRIIAPSNSTKQDIIRISQIDPNKIIVIPNGYDKQTFNRSNISYSKPVFLPDAYFVCVGAWDARKNLRGTMTAYAEACRELDQYLVFVGKRTEDEKIQIHRFADQLNISDRILDIGYIDDEVMVQCLGHATALVFLSLYEGFGLPALEAMAVGCPVVASNLSSVPEVCGDAAIYASPYNSQDCAEALRRIARDAELSKTLSDRGLRRAANFSWRRVAKETWQVYKDVIS